MRTFFPYFIVIIFFGLLGSDLSAQEEIGKGLEIDKMVHNFGDIILNSGPVSCKFTLKNNGNEPAVIYNVTTSCGCTDVDWTKNPIKSGESGMISVTYSNDEGAYPFNKNITVYISGIQKPIILKLRGYSHERVVPIEELYPVHYGPMGFKEERLNLGYISQGKKKNEKVIIANVSDKEAKVEFNDISRYLDISVSPNPIPAKSTAELEIEISANSSLWGRNEYSAVPCINGKSYDKITIQAFTRDNFDNLTEEEIDKGSMPRMYNSSFSFGRKKVGTEIHATFKLTNEGKSCFCVYKVDVDACKYSHSDIPKAEPGEEITFRVHIDTSDMPAGKFSKLVTLTTNSPLRPTINLFVIGELE